MIEVISVAPIEGGWMVDADMLAAPLMFRSGGKAEAAAKRLGEAFARAGRWAEVRVHLRSGEVFGRFLHPPAWAPTPGPPKVEILVPPREPPLGLRESRFAAA